MSLRSLPWRVHTPPSRIKALETTGGRNARHYLSNDHRAWAASVKQRDGFACQQCGGRGGRLIADHIIEIDDGGALLDVKNGMTLCLPCHNRKTAASRAERMRR